MSCHPLHPGFGTMSWRSRTRLSRHPQHDANRTAMFMVVGARVFWAVIVLGVSGVVLLPYRTASESDVCGASAPPV